MEQISSVEFEDKKSDDLKLEEKSDKADSGMDEDSQPYNALDDDEDDDEIITTKKSKKTIFDDDEDSEDSRSGQKEEEKSKTSTVPLKTADEVLDAVMNDDGSESELNNESSSSDDGNETLLSTIKKKKKIIKRTSIESDSEDEADKNETKTSSSQTSTKPKFFFGNSDLFDAEEDSESNAKNSGNDTASDSNHEDNDEGFDDVSIDPKLLKKLKKGASKRASKPKKKIEQEDRLKLHSETQRIVRESRVNIPYHQPEPKPLQDFLARATHKQQQYRALRGTRDSTKAKAVEEILSKTKLSSKDKESEKQLSSKDKDSEKQLSSKDKDSEKQLSSKDKDSEKQLSSKDKDSEKQLSSKDKDSEKQLSSKDKDSEKQLSSKDKDSEKQLSSKDKDSEKQFSSKDEESEKQCDNSTISLDKSKDVEPSPYLDKEVRPDDDCDSLPDITDNMTEENEGHVTEVKECHVTEVKEGHVISDEMNVDDLVGQSNSANMCTDTIDNADSDKTESKHCSDSVCKQTNEYDLQYDNDKVENENKENECSDNIDSDTLNSSKGLSKKLVVLSDFPSLPKLSGGNFIDLDVNSVSNKNPGVDKLMDRFLKHSKKKHKHVPKDVELCIVQKEKTEMDKEELKLNTFVYHVTEEKEDSMSQFDAPGAKLIALKEKLKEKMKVKREEHRKQRQEIFDMDNEEGYVEDDEEDKVLDDDKEMTDESDTDIEDDDFDEQFGEEDFEEEEEKEENPFCDDEAEVDEEDDDEMELRLHLSSDEDEDKDDNDGDDEDDDAEDIKPRRPSSLKKKPRMLAISDDEESKLSVPEKNVQADVEDDTEKNTDKYDESVDEDNFTPFSKHISAIDNTQPPPKKSLCLPVDDSQGLGGPTQNTSQGSHFYIEESQMLDADGFLKFGSERKAQQPASNSPNFKNLLQTQESGDMNELLGLCSGRFIEDDDKRTSCKNLFGTNTQSVSENTQGNMDELLGLCSGKFISNTQATQKSSVKKRKAEFDEESNSSVQMVDDADEDDFVDNDKNAFSDEEIDEVDDDTNSVQSEQIRPFKGLKGKSGNIRKEFVDEEAELSGSEYDSDENFDLAEEDDIMEAELGDNDVTATEEELRNQVGRAHLKQMIDDDKRELMKFQEMYLPDGDLHSDAGRMRRFKWSNIDDDTQQDIFDDKSDDEKEEEEGEEAKWRKDRYEREKWLQEQQENEKMEDEDSQFLKLGKVFLKRQDSDSSLLKKPEVPPVKTGKQSSCAAVPKLSSQRRGSFLGRDKEALAKIANMTKAAVNPSGARNSGKFVFQVISQENDSQSMPAPSEAKVKKTASKQPPTKKPRLERSASFSQSSIFNHL